LSPPAFLLAGQPRQLDADLAEHALEHIARPFLHARRGGAVGVMRLADQLIDRRAAGSGFVGRGLGGERGGGAVEVGVDALFVRPDVIDAAHDQQLALQRGQRFEHAVVALGLQRGGHAEADDFSAKCLDTSSSLSARS